MQKATFLFFFIINFSLLAQNTWVIETGHVEQIAPQNFELTACSQFNPDNDFEMSVVNDATQGQLVANDLIVEPNEVFTLEQIIANFTTIEGVIQVDIIIWDDIEGKPHEIIFSELAFVPDEQNLIGVDSIANDNVYETVCNLPNPVPLEGGASGARYWIQIVCYPITGIGSGWGVSSESIVGLGLASNNTGEWVVETGFDGVYMFSGDCSLLNTEEHIKELISIYPNPVKNSLTINPFNSLEIKGITLFDTSGRKHDIDLLNNRIDLSSIPSGLYLLQIQTTSGVLTEKIIKE